MLVCDVENKPDTQEHIRQLSLETFFSLQLSVSETKRHHLLELENVGSSRL